MLSRYVVQKLNEVRGILVKCNKENKAKVLAVNSLMAIESLYNNQLSYWYRMIKPFDWDKNLIVVNNKQFNFVTVRFISESSTYLYR